MLRIVLDTNVIVSALLKPSGPPGRILARLLDGAFELVLSPALIDELKHSLGYRRVRRYLRLPAEELEALLARLAMIADMVPGAQAISTPLRDARDVPVLVAAVEGRADCVVTGDKDLLVLGEYDRIAILAPRDFLDLLSR